MKYKIPISVLVVIHTINDEFLLLERQGYPEFWQSVTGSIDEENKALIKTAAREVFEETGISAKIDEFVNWQIYNDFEIYLKWRHRYAHGVTHNREHMFSLLVDKNVNIQLAQNEHSRYIWCNAKDAIDKCFSPTNKTAIEIIIKNNFQPKAY